MSQHPRNDLINQAAIAINDLLANRELDLPEGLLAIAIAIVNVLADEPSSTVDEAASYLAETINDYHRDLQKAKAGDTTTAWHKPS